MLAFGLTEQNPVIVQRAMALHPRYLRIMVIWSHVQPTADPLTPDSWRRPTDPKPRGVAAKDPKWDQPWNGIQAQMENAQRLGLQVLLSVIGPPPAWAGPVSVATGYEALISGALQLAHDVSCPVFALAPYNEPNHPYFMPEQAQAATNYLRLCDLAEPIAAKYKVPLMIGELASFTSSGPNHTGIGDFIRHLHHLRPDALNEHLSVHDYAPSSLAIRKVAGTEQALATLHALGHHPRLWVTETGANTHAATRSGRQLQAMINRWKHYPEVHAAFQYTFRGDPAFPTGLAKPDMSGLEPAYHLWEQERLV